MKKTIVFVATAVFFFLLSLMPFSADARGGHAGVGGSTHITKIEKKDAIFHVSPQQFRYVDRLFAKKYPGYKCSDDWQYNYDYQEYMKSMEKGERQHITISLLMDGWIEVGISENYTNPIIKKIGRWDK